MADEEMDDRQNTQQAMQSGGSPQAIRVKGMSGRLDVLWAKVEVLLDPVYDSASACAGRTYRNRNA